MDDKWIIAIDQGTSGCRAFAIDSDGKIRAQKSKVFSPHRPQKGLSFYQAEQLLTNQVEVLNALLDEVGPEKAAALAVCSQRSTVVLWDKNTGRSVAPVLTWEDGRALKESQAAPITQAEIHQQTGLFNTPYFSAPKIAWCLANHPEAKHAAETGVLLAAPVASYLIWHLTKGSVFATDPTLAQRTLLWDIQTRNWSASLCQVFGVPLNCLPTLQPTQADYGTYVYKGVSIPICVCVADQQAAVAYHALQAGQTTVNYGTGAFVLHHTGTQLTILPGMLSSVTATRDLTKQAFLLEGPIFTAGSLLEWLKTKNIEVNYSDLDPVATSAQNPIFLLPALGGLGAPYWNYKVSVSIENVTQNTQSADWIAGALRAIACRVTDIISYLRLNHLAVESLITSGGLSKSDYLLQSQANVAGVPVWQLPEVESTVLGSAYLAAYYLKGNLPPWTVLPRRKILPSISASASQTQYQLWQQFVRRHLAV